MRDEMSDDVGQLDPRVADGLYVVIPAFNEGPAIGEVVQTLLAHCVRNVVVVDDGSADDTGAHASAAGATVLRHLINRGQGAGLQTGISYALRAGARYIVTFDADGQHPADALPRLLAPILCGEADIVLGSRFIANSDSVPWARRMVLRCAVLFTRFTSGARVTDAHNGLRAFSAEAASRLDIRLDRMAHASELIDQVHTSGLRYVEEPVEISYTSYSMAKGQHGTAAFKIAFDYLVAKLMR